MTRIDSEYFIERWIERAENDRPVDKADRFISLWIAFNGWMRGKYGENIRDGALIEKVQTLETMESVFNKLKAEDSGFIKNLNELEKYTVANMKFPDDETKTKRYDGTFESLIGVIYQIRCNLFHGRKDPEKEEKDFELVCLSYDILLPLFKEYLGNYGTR